jgi:hypothetical protein
MTPCFCTFRAAEEGGSGIRRESFILFVCSYTTHLSQVLSMEAHQRIATKELSDSTIRAELFYLHSVKEMEWGGLSEIAPAGAAIYHT